MRITSLYLWITVCFGAFWFVNPSNAQDKSSSSKTEGKTIPLKKYQITVAPTKLLSTWSPSLELGFEHKLKNPRHALFYEVGFIVASEDKASGANHTKKAFGFKIKPAYRIYLNKNLDFYKKYYVSLNYLFRYEDRYRKTKYPRSNTEAEVNKIITVNGLFLNVGAKRRSRVSPLTFEFEGGVGLLNKNVSYSRRPNNIISLATYSFYQYPWLIEKRGNSFHYLLNFTIRVGYEF